MKASDTPATPAVKTQKLTRYIRPTKPSIFDVKPEVSKHIPVDVSSFLVEKPKNTKAVEVDTQTNEFEPRPPTPEYVPKKTGVDVSTQIYPEEQLFNFDLEVGPILDVVTSKTLEQSLLEVEEEEELKRIRFRQEELMENKMLQRNKIQELEFQKRLEWKHKQERVRTERDRVDKETVVYKKVGSVNLMKSIITTLRGQVYDSMEETGFFQDPTKVEVQQLFMPWLLNSASSKLGDMQAARTYVDTMIGRAMEIAASKQEHRKCFIRVKARADVVVKIKINNIGPVVIAPKDTIATIRARLQEWVRSRGVSEEELVHLRLAYNSQELDDSTELLNIPGFQPSMVEIISDLPPVAAEDTES